MKRRLRSILAALLIGVSANAQSITATLSGTVTDPNGAVVPNATVTAVSASTALTKKTGSDSEGRYTIPFLAPGIYSVTAGAAGFAAQTRSGLPLEVAQSATLDFALTLGSADQKVTITEEAPLLNAESAGIEYTLERKLIEDLPSGERSTLALINTMPGVIDQGFALAQGESLNTNGNAQGPIGSPGNRNFFDSNFGVGGGQASTNDVLLDGVSDTIADFNGVALSPPQDSVQEFKVLSGVFSAEYGRSGGAIVNFITKAGGSRFHGSLYEYFQNGGLNANGWQRNRAGYGADGVTPRLPRIAVKRNQFGGSAGGPLLLPKLGRSKNTFFFFNYEGRREDNPFSKSLTVPTAKMRAGDLSELLQPGVVRAGIPVNADGTPGIFGQIYDPYGPLTPNGKGNMVRQAIPGNRMDRLPLCGAGVRTSACLDPAGLKLLTYLPPPNQPGLTDNYLFSSTTRFTRDIYAGRLDRMLSERHSIFGRVSREDRFQGEPSFLGSVASNARIIADTFLNFTFNDVYTFTPHAIDNFRYGYTRARAHQVPVSDGFDPTVLGLPSYIAATASSLVFPVFNFAGGPENQGIPGEITGSQIGGGGNNQPRDTQTLADSVTLLRAGHTLKMGGEYRLLRFFANQNNNPTGTFSFSRTFTRGPVPTSSPANSAETGSSLASLLLGLPASGSDQSIIPLTLFHHYGAAFVQDDWRATRNLTFNLGLRWDFETGTEETHGQITSFDLAAKSQLSGRVATPDDAMVRALRPDFANLRGLLSFPDGPQTSTNWNRFAPRAGFAYRVNDKMTIRGGYGLTFVPQSLEQSSALGVNITTSLVQSTDPTGQVILPGSAAAPTVNLSDPFRNSLGQAPGRSLGADTQIGQSPLLVEPHRANSYIEQYNFVIQRALPANVVLDMAYVGTHGVRLPFPSLNLNQLPTEFLDYARANFAAARDANGAAAANVSQFFSQQVTNPFFGTITNPNSPLSSRTVRRDQLLKPYPQYDSPQIYRPLIGASKYNSLQVSVRKRFSSGLVALANYTFSKFIDIGAAGNNSGGGAGTSVENIYNVASDYTLSNLDVPHRFTASFTYELPFARNRNGLLRGLIGGWQTSGTVMRQSGTPVGVVAPGFGLAYAVRRADRLPGVAAGYSSGELEKNIRNGGYAFNPDAFVQPADFVLGTAARNYGDVRRDSYKNLNLGLLKNFYFGEKRHKVQLRGEFINALNQVVFGTPGRDVSAKDLIQNGVIVRQGTFARVTTQGNTPRTVQLVLRYSF